MPVYVDHALKLTYEDLRAIPEDDPYRHEILDGMHVSSPSPTYRHQRISRRLQYQLYGQIELTGRGEVVYAPMDTEIGPYDVVEPDILVILAANRGIITASHVKGVPDLLVEILSPSTADRDRGTKVERYGAAGVPEYWIVDGDAQTVEVYRPDATAPGTLTLVSRAHDHIEFRADDVVARVDLTMVWAPGP